VPTGWDLTNSYCDDGSDPGSIGLAAGETVNCYFENRQRGSLEVTKIVVWNGVDPDVTKTFTICIEGPSYPTPDCKIADYDGGMLTWDNLIPGDYIVTEEDPGVEWGVTITGSPATVPPGGTGYAQVRNSQYYVAYTPGFWKNHTADDPSGHNAWQYTAYLTTDLLGIVFPDACLDESPRGSAQAFEDFTLLEALSFKGGRGNEGAKGTLLRIGVASLLNASINELMYPLDGFGMYPYSSTEIIEMVTTATCSGDRQEMLNLAYDLDQINNDGLEYFDWTWPVP
jgi:hypothetical protein